MRRVVVTGMGMLSPMGRGVETTWQGLINGKSAITPVSKFDVSESTVKIAGQIPFGKEEGQFDPDTVMAPKEQRRVDPFILYGVCAGMDAIQDSGWLPQTEEDHFRTGIMVGAGIGGLGAVPGQPLRRCGRRVAALLLRHPGVDPVFQPTHSLA